MGLAVRIIPTILCRGRQMVKGTRFDAWRSVGLAAQAVRIHAMRGVDEVCLLDIGATPEGRGPDLSLVSELAEKLFVPLAVGGGVRTIADVRDLLRAGADKVVIGTIAIEHAERIREMADTVGSQAIVAAVDARPLYDDCWVVSDHCGKRKLKLRADNMARLFERQGAGEILLTSTEREGTMRGYDLELIRQISPMVDVPVIAHGGCGTYQDMVDAVEAGASAVAAGAMFQFTDQTPQGAAEYLAQHGIETRIPVNGTPHPSARA